MSIELLILIVMLATFALGVFLLKLPAGVSLMLAAITGALTGGEGIPVRHLVEGSFGFLEAILIIATAMIFMKVVNATGALGTISYGMIKYFYRSRLLLMIIITLFIMFPGMLTGLSSACILTTGALVVPALLAMGIPPKAAGALIAMAAVFGEIAPPISIPAMIIGGGVDMPYIGFGGPLFLASFPPAILTAIYFRYRYLKKFDIDEVLTKMEKPVYSKHGIKLFIPLIVVIALLIAERTFPELMPHLGIPLIFLIGALIGFGTGEKYNLYQMMRSAVRNALPVMSILVGVGMFIQIMALTGVRGFIAVTALEMPESVKYLAALIMPFFGSAYASASVIGVPLVFVFIGKSEIVVASALALLAAMGDLMPPPSLLCAYAGQLVKVKNHFLILKESIAPIALTLAVGVTIIIFSQEIGDFLVQIF
ncbi:TRAP transporter large permease subunit [bacterium BMS3Abin03]|nr:TRAP transporter large permease subunit [bacterium BMS3Abin03]MCG6958367.1 TRAP transporter large permease subunit [bacterium BMS3Abin03]